jgi:oxygen-independent coproporphyrinogen-3 oxidase
MAPLLPQVLRMLFTGRRRRFAFTHQEVPLPPRPDDLNLYIHLPFCRHLCPFCPYVKQAFDRDTADAYRDALLRELDTWRHAWGPVPVASVYFGGGTPSMTPDIIEAVMSRLRCDLRPGAEVGVEAHPLDARPDVLRSLRACGVTMLSLGVQTFSDRLLRMLGRDYDSRRAREACESVLEAGFDGMDIDLIFAIPGQSVGEAMADVAAAIATGAGQVSAYPLIQFSDTPLAAHLKSAEARLPSRRTEQRMLQAVVQQARKAGYERSSIWSFNRPGAPRYTTVTRDAFVGIGAGASSRMGDWFWLNTFSAPEYIRVAGNGDPPALATRLDEGARMAYWLFWRCYDTVIDTVRFRTLFGRGLPGAIRATLALLQLTGLARIDGETIRLTDTGAYLFHLVEQAYTHAYLEKLWAACRREAWPGAVEL